MKDHKLEIPFYISTNNKHMRCLEVFVEIFNFFLPNQKLNILGYDNPDFKLSDNCNFISMGKQGSVNEWSTDLGKYFMDCKDKYFIYGTEDTFFYKQPNIEFINYLIKLIKENKDVGRINLVDGTESDNCTLENSPHYRVDLLSEFDSSSWGKWKLYQQNKYSDFAITTQFSIWDRNYFLKYMKPNRTPWEFEGKGSLEAMSDMDYRVLMVDENFPINKKEGYKRGTWENTTYWKHFLKNKTKQHLGSGL
tara:strand:- start:2100 stop:2849 length:750 start_codon:yes stop_codon:yes gene_type:complete